MSGELSNEFVKIRGGGNLEIIFWLACDCNERGTTGFYERSEIALEERAICSK